MPTSKADTNQKNVDPAVQAILDELAKEKPGKRPTAKSLAKRTELAQDAPAPHLQQIIQERGPEPTADALVAWDMRLNGTPIIDVAHHLGCSIELAKHLISEVHNAIHEDLKANLELNRTIDLHRIDKLIASYLPVAEAGDDKAATIVLKALQHRARLTGSEPTSEPIRGAHVDTVQQWIINVLPNINRLVDELPKG